MKAERIGVPNSGNAANNIPRVRKSRHQREVESLIREMSDSDSQARGDAALQVGDFEPDIAKLALPRLIELLDDNDEYVVVGALTSIRNLGSEVEMTKDALLKIVLKLGDEKHKPPNSRCGTGNQYNAAYALASIGSNAKEVVNELVEQIEKLVSKEDFDFDLVKFAVFALAMIGKDAEVARPLLMKFKNGEIKCSFDANGVRVPIDFSETKILPNVSLALAMIEEKEDEAIVYLKDWLSKKYFDDGTAIDELKKVAMISKCGIKLLDKLLGEKDLSKDAIKAVSKALKLASKK